MHFQKLQHAQSILKGVAHRTPVLSSRIANATSGLKLVFKCENFQRVGAFKFRGAYYALSQLDPTVRSRGVVTYSSGNHAQAIALAAQLWQCPALIVAPSDAPHIKMAATRAYGARIHFYNRYQENREEIANALASSKNLSIIPPFDHPDIIAGQGTCAIELFEEVGPLDALLVPLGGGGLLAGCSLAAKHLFSKCKVIGVEPEAGNDGQQSFRQKRLVSILPPQTIADGAQTTQLGRRNLEVILQNVDDILTVSDEELLATMRFLANHLKLVVEPTGCLAAAAALHHKLTDLPKDAKVGVILSGGNVDLGKFAL